MEEKKETSSQNRLNLYKALLKAQPKIEAAVKDSKNPHFKSTYADINSVIQACKEELNKVGIVILQPVAFDDKGVFVNTILTHAESGESVSSSMPLLNTTDMQKLGSAITYARRYSLQSLVLLGAEDDDGNAAVAQPQPQPQQVKREAPPIPKEKNITVSEDGKTLDIPDDAIYSGSETQKWWLKYKAKENNIDPNHLITLHTKMLGNRCGSLANLIKELKLRGTNVSK